MSVSTELSDERKRVPHQIGRRMRKRGPRPSQAKKTRMITLDHIDRRTNSSRRALELISTLESERGGSDTITEGVRQLCQRVALLSVILEDFESRFIGGAPIDLADYLATVATQRRVLQALGLQRSGPRDVTPSLSTANSI
jgi:hypothetical protein